MTDRAAAAPAPIGPYRPSVRAGETLYCSGQIPLDPQTGELVGGDVATQTDRVIDNLVAVLNAAGYAIDDVVKTTIYLVDIADFTTVNERYARRFGQIRPARSTVAVAALPKGARVEIDAIAMKRG